MAFRALVLVACLALPAAAQAAGGWSAPATLSGDGAGRPRVLTTAEGDTAVAWSGVSVQSVFKRHSGAFFGTPQTLSPEPGTLIDLAGTEDGDLTALWVNDEPAVESAWGVAGDAFGPRVRFPFAGIPLVAAAPAGDAFYVWAEGGRLFAVRRHEGTFGRQREVAGGYGLAAVVLDAAGRLNVIGAAPDGTVVVMPGTPEAGFAPPRGLSPPGSSAIQATTNGRGDMLVSWTAPDGGLAAAASLVGMPDWGAAEPVPGSTGAQQLDAALDDEGNALLAWTDGRRVRLGYRHADGRWDEAARLSTRPVCCTATPPPPCCEIRPRVGFDGRGTAVILWQDAEPARVLRAAVRPPDGPVRPFEVVAAAPAGGSLAEPDLAVDTEREAVAVWSAEAAGGLTHIAASGFDPSAPVITRFELGFSYLVSEPASVRADVYDLARRPVRRLGTLRSNGTSRAGRLTPSKRLAKRLRRKGRYRATITATTRGGRHPQPRTIDFRRLPKAP
jgi:hypothetical protein